MGRRVRGPWPCSWPPAHSRSTSSSSIVDPTCSPWCCWWLLGLTLLGSAGALMAWLVAIGIGFAALVLVHEDVILIEVPWALVLVPISHARPTGRIRGV